MYTYFVSSVYERGYYQGISDFEGIKTFPKEPKYDNSLQATINSHIVEAKNNPEFFSYFC